MREPYRRKQRLFDAWAPHYDWLPTTAFYQAIHARLLAFVTLPEGARVLELGCGTGRLLARLAKTYPRLRGVGLDLSPQMLRQARAHNPDRRRLVYVRGNAEALPFASGEFDAAFATASFLHYLRPLAVLWELARVLLRNGQFYWADWTLPSQTANNRLWQHAPERLHLYAPQRRACLARAVGLEAQQHHRLLGPVVLSVLARPGR